MAPPKKKTIAELLEEAKRRAAEGTKPPAEKRKAVPKKRAKEGEALTEAQKKLLRAAEKGMGKRKAAAARKIIEVLVGGKLPEAGTGRPARAAPRAVQKPVRVDAALVMRAARGDQNAIELLAKDSAGLERYLASERNREAATRQLFGAIADAVKKRKIDIEGEIWTLQNRAGYYSEEKQKPLDRLRGSERLAFMRVYLLDYVARDNNLFRGEIKPLGLSYGNADLEKKLDAGTFLAAAAYRWRWNSNNPADKAIELSPVAHAEGAPATAPVTKPGAVPHIGAIGDSITEGGRYARALEDILRKANPGARVHPYGKSSETTGQIASRFDRDILGHRPPYNTVIIQGGGNDIWGGHDLERTKKNIAAMIEKATKHGMDVILLTSLPTDKARKARGEWTQKVQERIEELNKWKLAQAGGRVRVVDLSSMGDGIWLKPEFAGKKDRIHPGPAGMEMIGKLIAEQAFRAEKGVPVVKVPPKTAAERRKLADEITLTLSRFVKGDPRGLAEAEKKRDLVAELPQDLRLDSLYLVCHAIFNHLKDNDKSFEHFLRLGKDEYQEKTGHARDSRYDAFMELRGKRRVTMHPRESGIMVVVRGAKSSNEAVDSSAVVRLLQEYLEYNVKNSRRFMADLGMKDSSQLKTDGVPSRELLLGYAVHNWRLRDENRDKPAGSWQKAHEQKAPAREF